MLDDVDATDDAANVYPPEVAAVLGDVAEQSDHFVTITVPMRAPGLAYFGIAVLTGDMFKRLIREGKHAAYLGTLDSGLSSVHFAMSMLVVDHRPNGFSEFTMQLGGSNEPVEPVDNAVTKVTFVPAAANAMVFEVEVERLVWRSDAYDPAALYRMAIKLGMTTS